MSEERENPPELLTRELVGVHIEAYDYWYERYDQIMRGALSFPTVRERDEAALWASKMWEEEEMWLFHRGLMDHLLHDRAAGKHTLASTWTPPTPDTAGETPNA